MAMALRILGVFTLLALGAFSLFFSAPNTTGNAAQAGILSENVETVPLENVASSAGSSLLARNPFSPQRGSFTREPSVHPNPAPRDVRLVGISGVDGRLRATLMIDGQQLLVAQGDETPIGQVTSLSAGAIEFAGNAQPKLELFP